MFKRTAYFFVFVSVFIVQGHDIVIHHHDLFSGHQHASNHGEEGHNVFSLIDLDEEFTQHSKVDISNNFVKDDFFRESKVKVTESFVLDLFIQKNEYPPPKPQLSFKSLRAPPINLFC